MLEANHEAAVALYRHLHKVATATARQFFYCRPGDERNLTRAMLVESFESAKANLEAFDSGVAFRTAIDVMMPGWKYVDASEYLPQEKWDTYISNSPRDWLDWLMMNGVPEKDARDRISIDMEVEKDSF